MVFFRILWPIYTFPRCDDTTPLILLGVVFLTTKGLYNISGLFVIFKCSGDLLGTCPRYYNNGLNVQFYCIKCKWHGMTEDIFNCSSFLIKKLLYPVPRHEFVALGIFPRGSDPPLGFRKAKFSDLCLLALLLTFQCELTLKSFPREPS